MLFWALLISKQFYDFLNGSQLDLIDYAGSDRAPNYV